MVSFNKTKCHSIANWFIDHMSIDIWLLIPLSIACQRPCAFRANTFASYWPTIDRQLIYQYFVFLLLSSTELPSLHDWLSIDLLNIDRPPCRGFSNFSDAIAFCRELWFEWFLKCWKIFDVFYHFGKFHFQTLFSLGIKTIGNEEFA